jgi:hypothetical protein
LEFLQYIFKKEYNTSKKISTANLSKIKGIETVSIPKYIFIIQIPKKNKKRANEYREVINIKSPYNIFYKELLFHIENIVKKNEFITENAHGFVKGKNILSNAKKHLNKKYILKIDVSSFFNSIKTSNINKIFIKLGCNEISAKLFSKLCTYDNVLKEGFNTSPILANLYCYDLDNELIELSKKYNLIFTRYSDDITFSSDDNKFPEMQELEQIFSKFSFVLNKDKTLFLKNGQSQYVTGLSISNPIYPRIPRKIKRKIRQDLYQLDNYFYDNQQSITSKLRRIYGKIVYVIGIEKELGKKYKKYFLEILDNNGYTLSSIFKDAPNHLCDKVFHYTDETDIKINNKHYIALSVISILNEDVRQNNIDKLKILKEEIITDFRNGLNKKQRENIFHYCEDNTYVKEKYQATLRTLDFEAFIIFIQGDSSNMKKIEYQKSYYKIFDFIIYNILRRFKRNHNYIYPEENSKISKEKLIENLSHTRGIAKFRLEIATKNEILLSIPDYILGIFRDCIKKDLTENIAKLKDGQRIKEDTKLDEILDKIRLVINLSESKYYARGNSNRLNCIDINKAIISDI